ncbi:MAG: aminotransferase class V-fold PLP-dependent enzyme [Bryobacterales bacterium]|nr:aminotransferase class V-fold PLP-dependent enzyme [Bryobacterales bacterium]
MTHSRRDLVRHAGAWLATVSALKAAPVSPAAGNEDYWRMVKRQFPLEDKLIYLNAANVCPASRGVLDRHLEYLRDFQANPSFQNRMKYEAMAERARGKAGALLGCDKEEIAFTRNTSESTNTVVNGLDLREGDEIVITAHNHPSNNDSWKVKAKRHRLVVKEAVVPIPAKSQQQLLDSIASLVTPRTKVIAVTHLTNTTGNAYPAKAIASLARQKGIWMHLDGAQTLGALNVNLRDIGCDSYAGSAHKWLMGPLEAGLLYVRTERMSELWPQVVTAGWSDKVAGARKFEVYGQRDNPRLVAVEAALDFLQLIGMEHVDARLRALVKRGKEQLAAIPGVELKTSLDPQLSGGVIKFNVKSKPLKEVYDGLWTRHRIAIAQTPAGDAQGLRISPHIYNTMDEMDQVVAAVKELVG